MAVHSQFFLFLSLLVSSASQPAHSEPPVYLVETRPAGEATYSREGTAFLIESSGYFLTASHLFRDTPGSEPYDGEIRLTLIGNDTDRSEKSFRAEEVLHQAHEDDADISLLKISDRDWKPKASVFEIGIKEDFERLSGASLEVVGYPRALPGGWDRLEAKGVRYLETKRFPIILSADTGGVTYGHSGSPLVAFDGQTALGVTYGSVEIFDKMIEDDCAGQSTRDFENEFYCEDDFYGYLERAKQRDGAVFYDPEVLSPPYHISRAIEPTRAVRFVELLDEVRDLRDVILRHVGDEFITPPLSAIEMGYVLERLEAKGLGYLEGPSGGGRIWLLGQVQNSFQAKRQFSLMSALYESQGESEESRHALP